MNHAIKKYRGKLEAIVKDRPHFKGAGKLTQKAIRHLTAGARAAIRMHSPTRNIRQLRHDLRNCPYHVFGEHFNCNPAFCKVRAGIDSEGNASSDTDDITEDNTGTSSVSSPPITSTITLQQQISDIIQQKKEDDMSPQTLPLQEETEARSGYIASLNQLPDGLFFSVLHAGDRLVSLAEQLVDNQTNNLAELYMGLRCYFDGGKVHKCVQSGSFAGRCYAAGLRYQEGPIGLLTLTKRLLASSLHSHW